MRAETCSERRAGLETCNAGADSTGLRGRPPIGREASDGMHRPVSAGAMASARMEDGKRSNTGSHAGAVRAATGTPRGTGWAGVVADGSVVLRTRGNARRGKGP